MDTDNHLTRQDADLCLRSSRRFRKQGVYEAGLAAQATDDKQKRHHSAKAMRLFKDADALTALGQKIKRIHTRPIAVGDQIRKITPGVA